MTSRDYDDISLTPAQKRALRRGLPKLIVGSVVCGLACVGVVALASPGSFGVTPQSIAAPIDAGWIVSGVPINAALLQGNLNDLQTQINSIQNPDCPYGYANSGTPAASFLPNSIVCVNPTTSDQVVKVGTGASAFWIDRYEATVWPNANGTGAQIPSLNSAYSSADAGVPNTGQTISPLYALSLPSKTPNAQMTWFQALEFCRASGKQLPTGDQWISAARGTYDPGTSVGTSGTGGNPQCNTESGGSVRSTDLALGSNRNGSCVSDWGAEDMIGNLWEWTSEWMTSLTTTGTPTSASVWPPEYNGDGTWNMTSEALVYEPDGGTTWQAGLPTANARGGYYNGNTASGIFAMAPWWAPSSYDPNGINGFRCVVPNGH